jgi:hypothetical protein
MKLHAVNSNSVSKSSSTFKINTKGAYEVLTLAGRYWIGSLAFHTLSYRDSLFIRYIDA